MTETIFTTLPAADLRRMIQDAVRDAFERISTAEQPATEPTSEYLRRNEVATILRISLATLHAMQRRGVLKPAALPGVRRPLYKRADIERLVRRRSS